MTFTYDCTARERREGSKLTVAPVKKKSQPAKKNGFGWGLLGWVVFVALATVLFVWLKAQHVRQRGNPAMQSSVDESDDLPHPKLLIGSSIVAFSGVGCLVVGIVMGQILNRRIHRRWNGGVQMSIRPDGLVEARDGVVTTTKWESFRGVEQGANVLILRSGNVQSVVIPKRLLHERRHRQQWAACLKCCRRGPPKRRFRLQAPFRSFNRDRHLHA